MPPTHHRHDGACPKKPPPLPSLPEPSPPLPTSTPSSPTTSPSLPAGFAPDFSWSRSILTRTQSSRRWFSQECRTDLCLAGLPESFFAARRQPGQLATQSLRIMRRLCRMYRCLRLYKGIRRVSGVLAVLRGVNGPSPVTPATPLGSALFDLEVMSIYYCINICIMGIAGTRYTRG